MSGFVLASLLPGLLIALPLGYVIRRWAVRVGLVDHPGHRKVHTTVTPLGGGLAIWAGLVLPLLLGVVALYVLPIDQMLSALPEMGGLGSLIKTHADGVRHQVPDLLFLLGCGTTVMLLGLADDRWGLDWKPRLLGQFLVAAVVVFVRGWKLTVFVDLPLLTGLVSVLWIVGLINSFNMLDNMDGLSAGIGAIAASMFAAVLLTAPDPESSGPQFFVAGLLLMLAGSLLGFLWHNRPPARLFMGDAGSYFLGFMLAVSTLLGTFAGGSLPRHAVLAPLCVLAVPLYDTITVVWIRLRNGQSPFVGDKNHFSHRLVDLGLSKPQAVLTIYLTTAACGLGALVLHQVNLTGALTIVLSITCLLAVIGILESTSRRKVAAAHKSSRPGISKRKA